MDRVQNIRIEVWKYRTAECLDIKNGKAITCSLSFYFFVLSQCYIVLKVQSYKLKKHW